MSEPLHKPEPYLIPKELAAELSARGLHYDLLRARELVKAMRASGGAVLMRRHVRASDALAWLNEHPWWTPYGAKTERMCAGVLCVGS